MRISCFYPVLPIFSGVDINSLREIADLRRSRQIVHDILQGMFARPPAIFKRAAGLRGFVESKQPEPAIVCRAEYGVVPL